MKVYKVGIIGAGSIAHKMADNPQQATIYSPNHEIMEQLHSPAQITGFEYEVEAAVNALQANAIETAEMPHTETLRVMQILDGLRNDWGVHYPMDFLPDACS